MITVDHLTKAFPAREQSKLFQFKRKREKKALVQAVQDVSFCAKNGQITGILGPNGAGKTTLLRMLATVLAPDQGTAIVDGYDLRRDSFAIRKILGVLGDAKGLYHRLTARENIAYYGALLGVPSDLLQGRIDTLLDEFRITYLADRPTHGFSQGERMKVALARILVHDPPNLILDEPANGLDVVSIRALRGLLLRWRAAGKCILFSSHVMQEVSALCDQIIVIGQGRVLATGTVTDICQQTASADLEEALVRLWENPDQPRVSFPQKLAEEDASCFS